MVKLICIDAGHCNLTPGKRSPDGSLMEHEFNLDVSNRIKTHLERHGLNVWVQQVVSRDPKAELNKRIADINTRKPDLVVSIHANAHMNTWSDAHGWEIFCFNPKGGGKSLLLAQAIWAQSIPYLGLTDRGIKDANGVAGIVTLTNPPAVLIEHGFYTNKEECALLKTAAFREKCAVADSKGILNYLGIPWKEGGKMGVKQQVQEKYGFEDATMEYLAQYKFANALLEKMLLPVDQQSYSPQTICYILDYKYGADIFKKLGGC